LFSFYARLDKTIIDALTQLSETFPKIRNRITRESTEFKRSPLNGDARFETLKERFYVVYSILRAHPKVLGKKREDAAGMVLNSKDLQSVEKILSNSGTDQGFVNRAASYAFAAFSTVAPQSGTMRYRNAKADAQRMTASEFMKRLPILLADEPVLSNAGAQIKDYFIQRIRERVHKLASTMANFVSKAELDSFNQHLHLETTALENSNRLASRTVLLQDLRKGLVQDGSSQ
jgi:hypothetical protein